MPSSRYSPDPGRQRARTLRAQTKVSRRETPERCSACGLTQRPRTCVCGSSPAPILAAPPQAPHRFSARLAEAVAACSSAASARRSASCRRAKADPWQLRFCNARGGAPRAGAMVLSRGCGRTLLTHDHRHPSGSVVESLGVTLGDQRYN
eukprot:1078700-Prorocentrum_minimum.AAC.1